MSITFSHWIRNKTKYKQIKNTPELQSKDAIWKTSELTMSIHTFHYSIFQLKKDNVERVLFGTHTFLLLHSPLGALWTELLSSILLKPSFYFGRILLSLFFLVQLDDIIYKKKKEKLTYCIKYWIKPPNSLESQETDQSILQRQHIQVKVPETSAL